MIYRLIILNGSRKGEQITVPSEPMILGKAKNCTQIFADDDMAQQHAEIRQQPGGIHVRDLGTMNKVLVNNHPKDDAILRHGDIFELGRTRFLLQAGVEAEVTRPAMRFRRHRPSVGIILIPLLILAAMIFYWRLQLQPRPSRPASQGTSTNKPPRTVAATLATNKPPQPTPQPPATVTNAPPTPPPPAVIIVTNTTTAPAALDTRIDEQLARARQLITQGRLHEADRLLESLQIMTDKNPLLYVERARLMERLAMLDPAIEQWSKARTTSGVSGNTAEAARAIERLSRGRTQPLTGFSGRVRIGTTEATRYPSPSSREDMRVVNVTLQRERSAASFNPDGIVVRVLFFDSEAAKPPAPPRLVRTAHSRLTVSGTWEVGETKTLSATSVNRTATSDSKPAAAPTGRHFYGYLVLVTYYGAYQDLTAQPKAILDQINLSTLLKEPVTADTGNRP